jgi:hypothetical protein
LGTGVHTAMRTPQLSLSTHASPRVAPTPTPKAGRWRGYPHRHCDVLISSAMMVAWLSS